ncbi:unnamed protein product [Nyctereutes procyonoides]|uniref:(raccoon dog) hypothetical protein n=1 Tax=Nyctereutes procyonoides TaxID=34880 RepID=A0A811YPP7_NYCPR|nr:unnamed protein product [Nyctereutes procyonoides]
MCTCGLQVPHPLLCAAVPGPCWARGHGWIEPPLLVVCASHLSLDICNLPPPPRVSLHMTGLTSHGPSRSRSFPCLLPPTPPPGPAASVRLPATPSSPGSCPSALVSVRLGLLNDPRGHRKHLTGSLVRGGSAPQVGSSSGSPECRSLPVEHRPPSPLASGSGDPRPSSTQRERTGLSPSLPCGGVSAGGQQAQAPLPVSPRPPSALLGSTDAFSLFVLSSFTLLSAESGVLSGMLGEVEVGTATGGYFRLEILRPAASGSVLSHRFCTGQQHRAGHPSPPAGCVAGWPVAAGPRPPSRSSPGLPVTAKDMSPEATLGTSWPPSAAKWLLLVKVINSRRSSTKRINHRTAAGFWESSQIFEEKPGCLVKRSVELVFKAKVYIVPNALWKDGKVMGNARECAIPLNGPPVASMALPETLQPLPGDGSVVLEMLCVWAQQLLGPGPPLTDPRNMLGPGPEPGGVVGDPECAASVATCVCWRPSWWRMELRACPPASPPPPPIQLVGKASPQHMACRNFSREKATDVKIFLLLVHRVVPVSLPCHPSTLPKNCVPFPTAEGIPAGLLLPSTRTMRSLSSQRRGEGAELDGTAQCPQPAGGQVRHRLHCQGSLCAHRTCCGDEGRQGEPRGPLRPAPGCTPSQPPRLRGKRGHSLRCSVNTLESGGESHFVDFLLAD